MSILRITYFKWGGSCNSWYPDMDAVERQLATEAGQVESRDITHTEWYECVRIQNIANGLAQKMGKTFEK